MTRKEQKGKQGENGSKAIGYRVGFLFLSMSLKDTLVQTCKTCAGKRFCKVKALTLPGHFENHVTNTGALKTDLDVVTAGVLTE